ncbi:hypothetical protein C8R44DRAFT_846537 [Mycena epipterygia]|nr:hypothetical protein C8R44DRAFT_846537 [Mycena epipterygia]
MATSGLQVQQCPSGLNILNEERSGIAFKLMLTPRSWSCGAHGMHRGESIKSFMLWPWMLSPPWQAGLEGSGIGFGDVKEKVGPVGDRGRVQVVQVVVRRQKGMIRDLQTNRYHDDINKRVRGWKAEAKVNPTPAGTTQERYRETRCPATASTMSAQSTSRSIPGVVRDA